MTVVLVWVLVTVGGYNGNNLVYSPPMATLESCQQLQKSIPQSLHMPGKCVQIQMVVPK